MKALSNLFIIAALISIAGCDSLNPDKRRVAYTELPYAECCPCNESGYYYNGYKENGWRYCVLNARGRSEARCAEQY